MNKLNEVFIEQTLKVRQINSNELKLVKVMQNIFRIILKYSKRNLDLEDYYSFRKEVEPYFNLSFLENFLDRIKKIDKELKEITLSSNAKVSLLKNYSQRLKDLENAFFSGNIDQTYRKAQMLSQLNDGIKKSLQSKSSVITIPNPWKISVADLIFGGGSEWYGSFNEDEMKYIVNLDINKYKFTYLNLDNPKDTELIIYFIKNLQDNPNDVKLNSLMFQKYQKFINLDNTAFNDLIKIVKKYLHGNDKSLIPKILSKMEEFPILKEKNEEAKKSIKKVYRGVGFYSEDSITVKEVIEQDKKNKLVATSENRYVAERFAKMIGHLESRRRSEIGYILTYSVNPNSIILVGEIFGSAFFEDEILIDVSKSKLEKVDEI